MPATAAYLGGRFVPTSEAHISIYDYGIVLGATITDLLRTFLHQPYRLEEHIERFYDSCKYARIAPPLSPRRNSPGDTERLIQQNTSFLAKEEDLAVVYFITPGENRIYAGSATAGVSPQPTFCISSFSAPVLRIPGPVST